MRVSQRLGAACLVLILPTGAVADSHQDLMQEVTAFGDALAQAILDNDAEAAFAMYVEDAISLPNYGPRMDGIESFRKHHEEMSGAGMKILSFENSPTEVWPAGDMVIEIGTFEISLEMPGAPHAVEDKGKYMTVYVRDQDGSLKIKAETWNTDLDPMAMMAPGQKHEGEG